MFYKPGAVANDSGLPDDLFRELKEKDDLLVIKEPRLSCMTVTELELYNHWKKTLAYTWEQDEWHENLPVLSGLLHRNFAIYDAYRSYDASHPLGSFRLRAQNAVRHRFHGGKYENTMRQSLGGDSLRYATVGDAILRLLATAVVDAIADAWKRSGLRVPCCFLRDGAACESTVAKEAVRNERLALLFDKMCLGSVLFLTHSRLSCHTKADIMEYIFAKLYETEDENVRLAELLLACMIQTLVFFTIYDIKAKRCLLPYLSRGVVRE